MKRFVFNEPVEIPGCYMYDVTNLRRYIVTELKIYISEEDTYKLWRKVSDYFDACWLNIEFHYDDDTREEFLTEMMEKFGIIRD